MKTFGDGEGLRGAPHGALDMQMEMAAQRMTAADVTFQRGLGDGQMERA
ncbi:MAG: hypothetical protein ACSHWY_07665 [Octadecabacter sp.]